MQLHMAMKRWLQCFGKLAGTGKLHCGLPHGRSSNEVAYTFLQHAYDCLHPIAFILAIICRQMDRNELN